MKLSRLDDLVERMHRRFLADTGEVPIQVVLELIAPSTLRPPKRIQALHLDGVDHSGAHLAELAHRATEDRRHFRIERRCVVGLMKNAEPRALQAVATECLRVGRDGVRTARRGGRIAWILAGNHLKD